MFFPREERAIHDTPKMAPKITEQNYFIVKFSIYDPNALSLEI